jgi:hypothetical protein
MAVTKIWQVHAKLDRLVDYVGNVDKTINPGFDTLANTLDYAANPDKTEQRFLVTGINCSPDTAYESMMAAHLLNDKPLRVLGYHAYQSFAAGEVSAKVAHEIGVKLAEQMWGSEFQVVVASHLNTGIYHNHFVLCSTSHTDGHRYHQCKAATRRLRETSDELCREYGLSVIKQPTKEWSKNYSQWRAEKEGHPTWKDIIREDLERALDKCHSDTRLTANLKAMGYEVKWCKELSIRPPGKERFMRPVRQLGEQYSTENLYRRFRMSSARNLRAQTFQPNPKRKVALKMLQRCKRGSLFWHYYQYRYWILLHHSAPKTQYISPFMRKECRKLDNITRQMKMLWHNKIESLPELEKFKGNLASNVKDHERERASLYGRCYRASTEDDRQLFRSRIDSINSQLKQLRLQLHDCSEVKYRSLAGHIKTQNLEVALNETARQRVKGRER